MKFISRSIEKAGWVKFLVSFILLFAYSYWAFIRPGFWSRANDAAAPLPETLQGFPEGEPARAFALLGEATSDYLIFQAVDIPFALLNAVMIIAAIGLGLKTLKLAGTPLRFLLILPLILFASEIVEDALLFLMAADYIADTGAPALTQQIMTNIKGAAGMLGTVCALAAIIGAGVAWLVRLFRKPA
ncbi:hypothetical protein ACFOOP_07830 [Marinicaulis aureus]|uniref:Uncharacterized protein n=1 Tax=Hyphococcus aureus TaxID=2666033 RepID=A0ABW1KSG1_9PROT